MTKVGKKRSSPGKKPGKPVEKSWYDYPQYYDLGFRSQNKDEANFFEAIFKRFVPGKVKRLLEPGCGSGRLIVEMAKRGYDLTGLDLNQSALDYTQKRLTKLGLSARLLKADMTDFSLRTKFDAAFNPINTFRHLLTEELAVKHLKLIAQHLRQGGVYLLGLHVFPSDADLWGAERWKATNGKTKVNYSLQVMDVSVKKRVERLRITMNVTTATKKMRMVDEFELRIYSVKQMLSLFAKVPEFELVEVYDFWCQIDEPQPINDDLCDAIFLLRKK